jgi:hypothetical protein
VSLKSGASMPGGGGCGFAQAENSSAMSSGSESKRDKWFRISNLLNIIAVIALMFLSENMQNAQSCGNILL